MYRKLVFSQIFEKYIFCIIMHIFNFQVFSTCSPQRCLLPPRGIRGIIELPIDLLSQILSYIFNFINIFDFKILFSHYGCRFLKVYLVGVVLAQFILLLLGYASIVTYSGTSVLHNILSLRPLQGYHTCYFDN